MLTYTECVIKVVVQFIHSIYLILFEELFFFQKKKPVIFSKPLCQELKSGNIPTCMSSESTIITINLPSWDIPIENFDATTCRNQKNYQKIQNSTTTLMCLNYLQQWQKHQRHLIPIPLKPFPQPQFLSFHSKTKDKSL